MESVKGVIEETYPLTQDLPPKYKKTIFYHVYNYAMIIIYPYNFPKEFTSDNVILLRQIHYSQDLSLEELGMTKENQHIELWDYCITRLFYHPHFR